MQPVKLRASNVFSPQGAAASCIAVTESARATSSNGPLTTIGGAPEEHVAHQHLVS